MGRCRNGGRLRKKAPNDAIASFEAIVSFFFIITFFSLLNDLFRFYSTIYGESGVGMAGDYGKWPKRRDCVVWACSVFFFSFNCFFFISLFRKVNRQFVHVIKCKLKYYLDSY